MDKTKVRCVTLMIVDHDDLGTDDVITVIENTRYPNRCITPRVARIESIDVEWSDEHPLNQPGWRNEFFRLFGVHRG